MHWIGQEGSAWIGRGLGISVVATPFKYLGTVLCRHVGMEGEIRERVMRGRSVVGSLTGVIEGRNVSMDVKRV